MPTSLDVERAHESVLTRMERQDRFVRFTIFGAAAAEALLIILVLALANLRDPIQRLLVVTSLLSYMILALGLIAVAIHVSREVSRIALALDDTERRR